MNSHVGGPATEEADALGLTDTCGRLARGRAADILVVRGNAVEDLGALLEVEAVYRHGEQAAGPSSRQGTSGRRFCRPEGTLSY